MKYWNKVTTFLIALIFLAVSCLGRTPGTVTQSLLLTEKPPTISIPAPPPAPTDTPTPVPTPKPAFARKLAQVCQGQGVPAASAYQKDQQIHPVLLLSPEGEWHEWNDQLPAAWQVTDIRQTELVACFGEPYLISIESCPYTGNVVVDRYQEQLDIRLVAAQSAETIATITSIGDPPGECGPMTTGMIKSQRIDGPELAGQDVLADLATFVASTKPPQIFHGMHWSNVTQLDFSADGKSLESQGEHEKTSIVRWNLANGQGETIQVVPGSLNFPDIVLSPDRRYVFFSGTIYETTTGKQLFYFSDELWLSATFSPDDSKLALISTTRALRVYDTHTGKSLFTLDGSNAVLIGTYFSPDSQKLIMTYMDGTVELWDLVKKIKLHSLEADPEYVKNHYIIQVSFSPQQPLAALSDFYGKVKLWNTATGELTDLEQRISQVYQLIFSQDGEILASGTIDGMIKLWNVSSQQSLLTLKYKSPQILPLLKNLGLDFRFLRSLAFSPDGKTLASGVDGDIILWDLSWLK